MQILADLRDIAAGGKVASELPAGRTPQILSKAPDTVVAAIEDVIRQSSDRRSTRSHRPAEA
jgi:hypothetical protein